MRTILLAVAVALTGCGGGEVGRELAHADAWCCEGGDFDACRAEAATEDADCIEPRTPGERCGPQQDGMICVPPAVEQVCFAYGDIRQGSDCYENIIYTRTPHGDFTWRYECAPDSPTAFCID